MSANIQAKETPHRIEQKKAIMADINSIKTEIEIAQRNFDCVCDPSEVDIYIYKLRTAHAQYDALLKKLKDLS